MAAANQGTIRTTGGAGRRMAGIETAQGPQAMPWRQGLLGGVGFAALLLAMPTAALADDVCSYIGDTVTCTGDVSDGISISQPYVTLDVNSLTENIAPASGTTGIRFDSDGPVHVTTDTGTFSIEATGDGADGIHLSSTGLGDAVSLDETGDVTSEMGRGLWLEADGPVSETGNGNVHSSGDAIKVTANEAGAIVDHTGNLTSDAGYGVYAWGLGSVQVTTDGDIQSYNDGINASSTADTEDGTVVVQSTGQITSSNGNGIYADSSFHAVTVTSDGPIQALNDGIYARAHGDATDASVTVHQTGDVTSTDGNGVSVISDFHSASATIDGDAQISAGQTGIYVSSTGGADDSTSYLSFNGDITSAGWRGIDVESAFHSASASVTGNINSTGDALYIVTHGTAGDASAAVTLTGNATSSSGRGVYVESPYHSASATITGNVEGGSDAIYIRAEGSDWDSTATLSITGDITSTGGRGAYVDSAFHAASATITGTVMSSDDGVDVKSTGSYDDASASATVNGNVTSTGGQGISVQSSYYAASLTSTGDVSAYYDGIFAKSTGTDSTANVWVSQSGDVTSSHGNGIEAYGISQTVQVMMQNGDVQAANDGVHVEGRGSSTKATANVTGNITATSGTGLYVYSSDADAEGTVTGDVNAGGDGVHVETGGNSSKATATVTGSVTSTDGNGVYVYTPNGPATAMVNGSVQAAEDGVHVVADGYSAATALFTGGGADITSTGGYGVYVYSPNADASEIGAGTIAGPSGGIYVESNGNGNTALVSHTGNVSSSNGIGVEAYSTNGKSIVNLSGNVIGGTGGILSESTGNTEADIGHTGTVTTDSGNGVEAHSAGGAAHITQTGDVTGGDYGIVATSESTQATVNVLGGTVSGASEAAVALNAITGAYLTNYGDIEGGDGKAIQSQDYGGTYVSNYGTVSGDVYVDDVAGGFTNFADGIYNITDLNFLGTGFLSNGGTVSPGGQGTVTVATLEGNYAQTADGKLLIDIDGTSADQLAATGTADLDGTLKVHFNSLADPNTTYTVLTSAGLLDQNLTMDASAITYTGSINYVNGTDVTLGIAYDFAPAGGGFNDNENAVGNALNQAYNDGNTALNPLLTGLANIDTIEAYAAALDQLTPDIVGDAEQATDLSSSLFASKLLSCRVFDGAYAFNAEGQCAWISGAGGEINRSQTAELQGFDQTTANLSLGLQTKIGDDWRLGFGVGHTTSDATNTAGATVSGDQYEGGVVLKYDHEATTLAAALTVGHNSVSTERPVVIGNFVDDLTGSGDVDYVSGRLHAAYTQAFGDMYIRPQVDLDITSLNFRGFSEAGGVAALDIADSSQLTAMLNPAIEFGAQAKFIEGSVMRPFVRFGAQMNGGATTEVTSSFEAASGDSFTTTSGTDKVLGTLDLGVDFVAPNNGSLRLFYDGAYGDTTTRQAVGFKLGTPF